MIDSALGKIIHKGRAYYPVGAAARLLSTTAPKVRELRGLGDLEWTQFRTNGRLMIPAESIVAYKKHALGFWGLVDAVLRAFGAALPGPCASS